MIRFSKYNWLYALISLAIIGTGIYSMVRWGYRVSIDFTGGTEVTYGIGEGFVDTISKEDIEAGLKSVNATYQSHEYPDDTSLVVRVSDMDEQSEPQFRQALTKRTSTELSLLRLNVVGPVIGQEAIQKTLIAVGLGIMAILGYIFFAFKRASFAFAAVAALLHDLLVVLGMYSLVGHFFGAQLDTLFVTGLLTTLTFSTHDTIVIFDKIREYRKSHPHESIETLSDMAVSATMARSINNSLTIVFMLVALVLLGGSSIRFFAAALLMGTLTGVYSSPFVAAPVMMLLERRRNL